jgi:hypothetical protein
VKRDDWQDWIECVAGLFVMFALLATTMVVALVAQG